MWRNAEEGVRAQALDDDAREDLRKQHKQLDLFQAMLAHGIEAVAQRDRPADEKMYEEQLQRARSPTRWAGSCGRAPRGALLTGALLAVEERIAIAGIFVRHAMTRTELGRVSWASARARTLYRLANARWYGVARHLAFVLLCAVVVIEPVRTLDGPPPGPYWAAATAAELACCAFFVADIGVLIGYQGRKEFFDLRSSVWRRRWDRWARLVLVALLCADALVALAITLAAGWVPFRPSRVLRVLLLPFFNKAARHTVSALAQTIPSLGELTLIALMLVLLGSLLAFSLFADDSANAVYANLTAAAGCAVGETWLSGCRNHELLAWAGW